MPTDPPVLFDFNNVSPHLRYAAGQLLVQARHHTALIDELAAIPVDRRPDNWQQAWKERVYALASINDLLELLQSPAVRTVAQLQLLHRQQCRNATQPRLN
jgi:hypothetical protein